MENIVMREQWVNRTENHLLGDSGWYESFTDKEAVLFRSLQKEYGRCTGKVYVDLPSEEARPIGWVFIKRDKYDDTDEYFLKETWIDLRHRYPLTEGE
jgi:hypothetical protein